MCLEKPSPEYKWEDQKQESQGRQVLFSGLSEGDIGAGPRGRRLTVGSLTTLVTSCLINFACLFFSSYFQEKSRPRPFYISLRKERKTLRGENKDKVKTEIQILLFSKEPSRWLLCMNKMLTVYMWQAVWQSSGQSLKAVMNIPVSIQENQLQSHQLTAHNFPDRNKQQKNLGFRDS